MYVEVTKEGYLYVNDRLVCQTNDPKKILMDFLSGLRPPSSKCV